MWVEGDSSSTKAEMGKVGRTVYPWGADGHEERAPRALQTMLDSEGTGSASGMDVPAEEQLAAASAALRCLEIPSWCLEIPSSLTISEIPWVETSGSSQHSLQTPPAHSTQAGRSVPFVPIQRE